MEGWMGRIKKSILLFIIQYSIAPCKWHKADDIDKQFFNYLER